MKLIKLSILLVILCIGSFTYSQETWSYVDNTESSSSLNGKRFIEKETASAWGSQGKIPNNKTETVPLKPLYELFTSSTCAPCVEANEILTEVLEANPDEYSLIKYQMNWPGSGDPYYTQEGGARRGYYGVSFVPDLYINSEQLDPASSISQEIFEEYAGMMTSMEIEIIEAFIDDENNISIEAEITPLENYAAGLTAHIVVVEKRTFSNTGNNGETEFQHVMMKMLPDASGTELEELTIGNQIILSETYNMDETNMETPNDLVVIIFVQDNSDKSVIQSEMANVNGEFDAYNISYIVDDAFGNPIEGAEIILENYGSLSTDGNGQVLFEEILTGTYEYSANYAGLIPYTNTITIEDENIAQYVALEHYTSLLESFNSGLPSSWTKHVGLILHLIHNI